MDGLIKSDRVVVDEFAMPKLKMFETARCANCVTVGDKSVFIVDALRERSAAREIQWPNKFFCGNIPCSSK